jgi:hypothetical protein
MWRPQPRLGTENTIRCMPLGAKIHGFAGRKLDLMQLLHGDLIAVLTDVCIFHPVGQWRRDANDPISDSGDVTEK